MDDTDNQGLARIDYEEGNQPSNTKAENEKDISPKRKGYFPIIGTIIWALPLTVAINFFFHFLNQNNNTGVILSAITAILLTSALAILLIHHLRAGSKTDTIKESAAKLIIESPIQGERPVADEKPTINQTMTNSPGGIQAGRDVNIHQTPQPRIITHAQNDKIVGILRANPPQTITVLAMTGDKEASNYAALIAQVLDNGGWQVKFQPFVTMMTPTPYGVQCRIADSAKAGVVCKLLQSAFNEGNIEITSNHRPIDEHPNAILVGLKP